MTLEEYRIAHSMLIEQYQWIEFDLEGLFALICGQPFHEAIEEIEKDSIGGVVRDIQKIEEERNITVFFQHEYEELDQIRQRRNFWSHASYTEPRDLQGVPQNADLLAKDLAAAKRFLSRLRQIKKIFAEKYWENPPEA